MSSPWAGNLHAKRIRNFTVGWIFFKLWKLTYSAELNQKRSASSGPIPKKIVAQSTNQLLSAVQPIKFRSESFCRKFLNSNLTVRQIYLTIFPARRKQAHSGRLTELLFIKTRELNVWWQSENTCLCLQMLPTDANVLRVFH